MKEHFDIDIAILNGCANFMTPASPVYKALDPD